jgi:hypothetical protein
VAWWSVAGCGLVAPTVSDLAVDVAACGEWTASVEAWGVGQQVRLEVDGEVVGSWSVLGGQTLSVSGTGRPGSTIEVVAAAGPNLVRRSASLPARVWAATLTPRGGAWVGEAIVLEGLIDVDCPVSGATWRLTPPTGAPLEGPVGADGEVVAEVGVLPPGRSELGLEVRVGDEVVSLPRVVVEVVPAPVDRDGDGHVGPDDCDEGRPEVHVDAAEAAVANGRDDDCDGVIDEGTRAFDDDGDGVSEDAGDCDDGDVARHPGAVELADCRDQDCDGEVDEGAPPLPQQDDVYEPNDSRPQAADLATRELRSFTKELALVTRDASDEAWFSFYSQDGDFDLWGIVATAKRLPDGAAYELQIVDAGGGVVASGVMDRDGGRLETTGRMMRDDSGNYALRVKPKRAPRPWCPVVIELVSR